MKSKEVISSEKDALQWLYDPSISGTLDQKFAHTKKKTMKMKEGKERSKQNKTPQNPNQTNPKTNKTKNKNKKERKKAAAEED